MSAKRISATSLLVALILVASFLSALLPQTISPRPAQAATVVVYTSSGTWEVPSGVTSVKVLVVAGGGGGGGAGTTFFAGGGGGAGGIVYTASYPVNPGAVITVTVGNGGGGGYRNAQGTVGGNSVFNNSITAYGGGGGGGGTCALGPGTGGDGGSGGGGSAPSAGCSHGSASPSGQGYNGGDGKGCCDDGGGGGGGSTQVGEDGKVDGNGYGGDGGNGMDYGTTYFGTTADMPNSGQFGGGGGGGGFDNLGSGGYGGGGNGAKAAANGGDATANTGGGGGGAAANVITGNKNGGNGAAGCIVIQFTANAAPTIGTVALWTTGGSPSEVTAMTPQVEYNIKVPMTDDDTLDDLVDIVVTLYYDSDGSYSEGEVPTVGNNQRCAILTWENGGSPAWTIETGSNTSWTIETSNCVEPTLSSTSGTFEFHFKPGKVATRTTGDAKWHIYVKATDSVSNTGTGTKTDLTMNWYGEIVVNTGTIDWSTVTAGQDFAEGDPSEETGIAVTYVCNDAYYQQIAAATSWSGTPSGSAKLNTGGTPGANEFSLKADDDGTLADAVTVSDSYQAFDTGTITSESGDTEAENSLWLKLGTPFTKATYSGTIYYQITQ